MMYLKTLRNIPENIIITPTIRHNVHGKVYPQAVARLPDSSCAPGQLIQFLTQRNIAFGKIESIINRIQPIISHQGAKAFHCTAHIGSFLHCTAWGLF